MDDKQSKLIPKLRFPEYKNDGEWQLERLGDIAVCFSGGTPTASILDYYGGDIPFIRSGEINCSQTALFLTQAGLDNSSAKIVEKGTILYALYGATSGEVGLAGIRGAINQAILAIEPKNGVDKLFVYQYLKYSKASIVNRFIQGGQGNLSAAIISNLLIPVPSFAEQKRISGFLTSLDNLSAGTKAKLEQLKAHKKGLMQRLFPAPGETHPEYRFPEFNDRGIWNKSTLGEIGEAYSGLSGKNKEDFGHGDAEYITYMNVLSNSIVKSGLNQPIEIDRTQHQVQYGDVFFTISSETPEEVGMSSVWLDNKANVYLNSFCFGYRLKKPFNYIYLSYYFRSPSFRKMITFLAQGIARYNISKNKVLELVLQYPPLDEQERIASCLNSLDESINTCSLEVATLVEQKKGLMQLLFPALL